jgi:hypothetical protein
MVQRVAPAAARRVRPTPGGGDEEQPASAEQHDDNDDDQADLLASPPPPTTGRQRGASRWPCLCALAALLGGALAGALVSASVAKHGAALAHATGALAAAREQPVASSDADDRAYRWVTLANGLQALLVSDPAARTAAAALDVAVGSLADPELAPGPGLAHFCEHMLFLGSERWPREDEYNSFLALHGGSANAYTSPERDTPSGGEPSSFSLSISGAM